MSKSSGLGTLLFARGFDLSGDIGSIGTLSTPSAKLDVSGINATGHERIYGRHDGALTFNAFFNDATDQEHLILRAKNSGADTIMSWYYGSAIGNPAYSIDAKQTDYAWTEGADGSLEATINALANGRGGDWCKMLTAGKRTDTGATNGASLDSAVVGGTAFGLAAYLHVFSFTGTSMTAAIQESSNDGAGDAFAAVAGMTFTAATAVTSQHLVTSSLTLAVERYLRVATTGTFNPCTFAICATRFPYQL